MNAAVAISSREHWHRLVTQLMELDCALLDLIPWESCSLSQLPAELHTPVMRKISEWIDGACNAAKEGHMSAPIERGLTKAIWAFAKSLKPDLTPFGNY